MQNLGQLLSYYPSREDARSALQALRRKKFKRLALLNKSGEGKVHTYDASRRRWLLWVLVFGLLLGASEAVASLHVEEFSLGLPTGPRILVVGLSGFTLGTLLGWLLGAALSPGVDRSLLSSHANWLSPDETLLILEAPLHRLSFALPTLRDFGESAPSIFAFTPVREEITGSAPEPQVVLPSAQLRAHAQRLARDHRADPRGGASKELLNRLESARRSIHIICGDLEEATRLETSVGPTAEWILDNEYIIESHSREVQVNLPDHFYRELPVLTQTSARGEPRVFSLAQELVSHTDSRLDLENINEFLEAYQSQQPLTIGELWAVPLMLRIALVESAQQHAYQAWVELRERSTADFWANRLLSTLRRNPEQLFAMLAELAEDQPSPSAHFGSQITGHLYDEEAILVPVQSWLERTQRRELSEQNLQEQSRQASEQISIGNAVTSLRQLSLLDWREIFETQSKVEAILRRDPIGVYPQMDFETRNSYRQAVEALARGSGASEVQVAEHTLELAARTEEAGGIGASRGHVGSYLVGEARSELAALIKASETLRFRGQQWIYHHHAALYLTGVVFLTSLLVAPVVLLLGRDQLEGFLALVLIALLGPTSQLAIEILNYLVTRVLPPRMLPKMDFRIQGIPDAYRTLVVVPVLLSSAEDIQREIEKLEIRYLANPEDNLIFSLFYDFMDAEQQQTEEDERLLEEARSGIEQLNQRYTEGRFYLFHRNRTWAESEGKFIGWERKRGKLEELNRLIVGLPGRAEESIVKAGDPDRLTDVRFVITLDSDTQLPRDTARRMIETLAHPLNNPRLDEERRKVLGGYAIVQPRVSSSLPSATATPFSRLFTDPVGIDPYTKAVSNAYQDLSGQGSYIGKGIYDPRAFQHVLSDRFPEQRLLSHDLIEGAYVRAGLATDIELLDEYPEDYLTHTRREHRWIRGDWQIAEWLLPRVPTLNGESEANPLSGLNRWKIFDNLRRSLVPAASVLLLFFTWLIKPEIAWYSYALIASLLLFQPLAQPLTWATTRQGLRNFSLAQIQHDLLRAMTEAALLPYRAGMAMDAIGRVLYRRFISHRRMLEWTTAQMAQWSAADQLPIFLLHMSLVSLISAGTFLIIATTARMFLPLAVPWLALWFVSPLVGWLLNRRPKPTQRFRKVAGRDIRKLRMISRKTWRYFSDFVGPDTAWLPPDNYQVSHQNQLAMRTSPTNIGMWMLSALGGYDFGYQTLDQVITALSATMETLGKLERYEGHLLNWYSLKDLSPLEPRYVSSVDSGNFVAALWTLKEGLNEIIHEPLLDDTAFGGILDTMEVLLEVMEKEALGGEISAVIKKRKEQLGECPEELSESIRILRELHLEITEFANGLREHAGLHAGAAYWARQLERQVSAWVNVADRYLQWVEILAEKSETELASLGLDVFLAAREDLVQAPSLLTLAEGRVRCVMAIHSALAENRYEGQEFRDWLDRLMEAFSTSRWLAGEVLGQTTRLIEECLRLSREINLGFLYDPKRRLFSVGFNLSENRLDNAYYDLLASEARLGSFVAIARGEVPIEHWLAMNRPYSSHGRRRVLLSWTGTMFEYLMPLIFQRTFPHSLMERAAEEAVGLQRAYGRRRRVPWGISESAYGDLDLNKTYQYKAFGVPWLGLKRGLEDDLVIAPYSTALAINVAPQAAIDNLKRLEEQNLLDEYGYYEAIDYSRRSRKGEDSGIIVRAFMAHHQGMSFLALDNFLNEGAMQRRFHADPRVQSVEPLLYERVPISPPIHHLSTREQIPSRVGVETIAPSVSRFDTPHTETPKVQLLSNGAFSLMMTNAGGGYSRWGEFELTRWRSDTTRDHRGSFCYLRDVDLDTVWSNTYHPVGGELSEYRANFPLDRAEFCRIDHGIETETEVIVSPEDDVEIRRLTLINRSLKVRRIELTSYIELVLAPHNTDRQHPAFNKMFIQTEVDTNSGALLAYRRARDEEDPPIYVAHRLTSAAPDLTAQSYETDRKVFIGRGRTLSDPMAVHKDLANTAGFVLDPIFSLRKKIRMTPGESIQVSHVLAAADSREGVLALVEKYGDPFVIERAFELAWASAQLELRLLRIQADEARRFQKLASHMLYPNALIRPPMERIQDNDKGQSGLWPYGISGDLPIALVSIGEAPDIGLVRQMLQAHTYWRQHGLTTDLVILNEESSSYEQPLKEQLEKLIQAHSMYTGVDRPGGVFLRTADQIPEEDLVLLQAAAHISLVAARGPLAQQLGAPFETPVLPDQLSDKRIQEDPSAQLPYLDLPYFNSLGGFTQDGREYAIYLGPETHTPAPWVNVIANPSFGTVLSETGAGFTWYGNSQRNRLTAWSNDPVLDPAAEVLYIRDEESGEVWTPTASPIRENTAYRARHGAGYSIFEHNSHAIEQELKVFVPMDEGGGEPVKLGVLRLRNDSDRSRQLSVTFYVEWTLGENRETTQQHIITRWDEDSKAVLARNGYHPDYGDRVAFTALSLPPQSYSGDRGAFLGRNGDLHNPAALKRERLSGRVGAGLDPCAAVQVHFELPPGESTELVSILGQVESREDVQRVVSKYRENLVVAQAFDRTQEWWDRLLGTLQVKTPDLSVDYLLNRWLLYQSLSCRIWGRSAFYQSGGAFGFRDQLQDVMAFLAIKPELAREQILLSASRQFQEGDVQHWWHPPSGAGIRSRISDDLLWLPFVTAQYVRLTDDVGILQERVPFLEARELEEGEHEVFLQPEVSLERATLFEHCRRAVERGISAGPHGLPLIGTGDWNDGMNRVGEGGKGESVWLAWFLVEVLQGMTELAQQLGEESLEAFYQTEIERLRETIERRAWDGEWYIRATFDDGTPIGSAVNEEARIDSLPQSWAWISGGVKTDRAEMALEAAWRHLVKLDEKLVLLFTPPFDQIENSPGYIKGYPPGVRENGGQYTHAALWLAIAHARKGDGERAAQLLRVLNPVEHARDVGEVWKYNIEPYVVAADIYRLPGKIGQGGWSWYTGSGAWMYRAWVEEVLGFKLRGNTLRIDPVIPPAWGGFQLSYRFGEAIYEIVVENPEHVTKGVTGVEMDGRPIENGILQLRSEPVKHKVHVLMGAEG